MLAKLKRQLKTYIDTTYAGWDISIALRYLPIVEELRRNQRKGEKILEVGSEITGITPYLKRKITGVDLGFDYKRRNEYLKPVRGSALDLPFGDKSFPYVLSVDVLEHIPAKLRPLAVREMMRVASKKVFLTFPCGQESEKIDALLDDYFYRKNGHHFTYLTEHVALGLPTFGFIAEQVKKNPDWKLAKVQGNTSNFLWVFLLKFGLSNVPWKTSIYRRLLLLMPILRHINFGSTYRKLYILERVGK